MAHLSERIPTKPCRFEARFRERLDILAALSNRRSNALNLARRSSTPHEGRVATS